MVDVIVVGAGFAGAVMAERFASLGKKVLVLEKRNHIAGNMYDYIDENNVNRHEYGPHLFHTNSKKVVDYLSNFTTWYPYEHRVLGMVNGKEVPIPFNLDSIKACFGTEEAEHLISVLVSTYGMDSKVPILKLKENNDEAIKKLADFIYEHVFQYYTMKQWGLAPEEIDPAVTGRVPVLVGKDDRYFTDTYQQMPKKGYHALFEKMFSSPLIEVCLNTDAKSRIKLDFDNGKTYVDGSEFHGKIIYTGAVDELCDYNLGELPYRSLSFDVQSHVGNYQTVGTVNYPTPASEHAFTRITEYKWMMETVPTEKTTIAVEYPLPYDREASEGNIPYYPIFTVDNQAKYDEYCQQLKKFDNIVLLGRLAEYKYYNMDAIVLRALEVFEQIK